MLKIHKSQRLKFRDLYTNEERFKNKTENLKCNQKEFSVLTFAILCKKK